MTQSLERAGDHAKNLAEEVCHFVSGRSIRHLLMAYDKPKEQMFIDWLRLKPHSRQCRYRSGKPLRHPKSSAKSKRTLGRSAPSALDSGRLQGETRFSPFAMQGAAHPEDRFPPASAENVSVGRDRPSSVGSAGVVGDPSNGSSTLAETELDSALQLLVERAQYITGATGTALALPQGEEMVCRASAGSSAPAVGARLQVRSGLTGESIARRQLLRCDNAETDPRVNLETCRALGIASIVVLPLLRPSGEVRGLFELFSDHPYAFEERDLIALERMADLTLTALDMAEQRRNSAPVPTPRLEPDKAVESPVASGSPLASAVPLDIFRTDTPQLDTPA